MSITRIGTNTANVRTLRCTCGEGWVHGMRAKRANKDSTPGVNGSYKWGAQRLTSTCAARSKAARAHRERHDRGFPAAPHPANTTNNGAARPPRPATRYPSAEVEPTEEGGAVAATCTMTISSTARPRRASMSSRRTVSGAVGRPPPQPERDRTCSTALRKICNPSPSHSPRLRSSTGTLASASGAV